MFGWKNVGIIDLLEITCIVVATIVYTSSVGTDFFVIV